MLSETENAIRAEDIVRAVIKHYFYPIISDNLIAEISDDTGKWHLKSDNIKDVVSQVVWPEDRELNREDLIQLIDMVRGGLKKPEDTWLRLNHSPKRNIEEMLPVQKETLMEHFDSGETLYFRIPVSVRRLINSEVQHL